jgi:hypothetical protein
VEIPLPLGDVLDRITILRIKARRITEPKKLQNVHAELALLQARWDAQAFPPLPEEPALAEVNERLWDVEDTLRALEDRAEFGPEFVAQARSVYQLNDQRAALKRAVNEALGSALVEEKSYAAYTVNQGADLARPKAPG